MKKNLIIVLLLLFINCLAFSQVVYDDNGNVIISRVVFENEQGTIISQQLGFMDTTGTYGFYDGGSSQFQIEIITLKKSFCSNKIVLCGKVTDCTGNTFIGINSYVGTKVEAERKISFIRCVKVDLDGYFKVKLSIDTNESVFFESIGFSILELIVQRN